MGEARASGEQKSPNWSSGKANKQKQNVLMQNVLILTVVDFTVTKLEAYLTNRLLKFAHSRNAVARLLLQCELKRAEYNVSGHG